MKEEEFLKKLDTIMLKYEYVTKISKEEAYQIVKDLGGFAKIPEWFLYKNNNSLERYEKFIKKIMNFLILNCYKTLEQFKKLKRIIPGNSNDYNEFDLTFFPIINELSKNTSTVDEYFLVRNDGYKAIIEEIMKDVTPVRQYKDLREIAEKIIQGTATAEELPRLKKIIQNVIGLYVEGGLHISKDGTVEMYAVPPAMWKEYNNKKILNEQYEQKVKSEQLEKEFRKKIDEMINQKKYSSSISEEEAQNIIDQLGGFKELTTHPNLNSIILKALSANPRIILKILRDSGKLPENDEDCKKFNEEGLKQFFVPGVVECGEYITHNVSPDGKTQQTTTIRKYKYKHPVENYSYKGCKTLEEYDNVFDENLKKRSEEREKQNGKGTLLDFTLDVMNECYRGQNTRSRLLTQAANKVKKEGLIKPVKEVAYLDKKKYNFTEILKEEKKRKQEKLQQQKSQEQKSNEQKEKYSAVDKSKQPHTQVYNYQHIDINIPPVLKTSINNIQNRVQQPKTNYNINHVNRYYATKKYKQDLGYGIDKQ